MIAARPPARLVVELGQAHHADTLAHGQAGRVGGDLPHVFPLPRPGEGQQGLKFHIIGEGFGLFGQHRAARRIWLPS